MRPCKWIFLDRTLSGPEQTPGPHNNFGDQAPLRRKSRDNHPQPPPYLTLGGPEILRGLGTSRFHASLGIPRGLGTPGAWKPMVARVSWGPGTAGGMGTPGGLGTPRDPMGAQRPLGASYSWGPQTPGGPGSPCGLGNPGRHKQSRGPGNPFELIDS
jgi:hypothetical protein